MISLKYINEFSAIKDKVAQKYHITCSNHNAANVRI